ncbi:NAD kinase [Vagococcus sp. DIV0080]|uniref:NAD kinase n=1 Tax=Candidatus Vagococcus giribetii TaxID=2230876 RepID=A0ABS3HRR5_9ENTE|nr:NAD kinase [Vagococcus sp. DIV0080]MBO0476437.1 NAD kinase [Vagococcus sp. DIV0080]
MKIAVVANQEPKSQQVAKELQDKLRVANFEIDKVKPDVVITVGGDGTLLGAFHAYSHELDRIRFIGVHTGHLGFYTDWRDYELDLLVSSLCEDTSKSVSYPLLDVTLTYNDTRQDKQFLALNEATVKNLNRTMVSEVFIKEELFEKFRGDGLSVSTPTGSTAYSKSLGGAVIHPRVNAIQLNEVASINNRVYRSLGSPLIIAKDEWITLNLAEDESYQLHIDHLVMTEDNLDTVTVKLSEQRIHFASYRHTHFWRRVNDAFIGE